MHLMTMRILEHIGLKPGLDSADEQSGMRRHPRLQQILAVLLRLWDAFELPPNPLDHLTELLGGPDKVR